MNNRISRHSCELHINTQIMVDAQEEVGVTTEEEVAMIKNQVQVDPLSSIQPLPQWSPTRKE